MERKLTKKEIKGPDVFISNMQRATDWLYDNRVGVGIFLALLVAASFVWAAVGIVNTRKEEAAQELLFKAEKDLKTADDSFKSTTAKPDDKQDQDDQGDQAAPKTAKKEPPKEIKPAAVKSGDLSADYKSAIPELKDALSSKYPSSQAAVVVRLDLSYLLLRLQKV